jgi:hypothetical protein
MALRLPVFAAEQDGVREDAPTRADSLSVLRSRATAQGGATLQGITMREQEFLMKRSLSCVCLLGAGMFLSIGCKSYYSVTDLATGQVHYTKGINQTPDGAVHFKDARTGADLALQNPSVQQIDERAYDDGMRRQAAEDAATTNPAS